MAEQRGTDKLIIVKIKNQKETCFGNKLKLATDQSAGVHQSTTNP